MLKGASVCIGVGIEDDENICWYVPLGGLLYEMGDWPNPFLLAHARVTFHSKVDHAELQSWFIKGPPLATENGNKHSHCWEHTCTCF